MVQRHHRLQAAAPQGGDHVRVVVQRGVVALAFPRLDPAPLDRQAVGVVAEPARQIEILLEQLVVATGGARAMGQPPRLLVLPPVVPPVVALDLVAGGGRAPEEAVGENRRR